MVKKAPEGRDPLIGTEDLLVSRGLSRYDDEYFLDLNLTSPAANSTLTSISPGSDFQPAISPDGTKIAFVSQVGGNDGAFVFRRFEIFIMNSDGTNRRRLTYDNFWDSMPTFSPDGTKIIYSTDYADKEFSGLGVFSIELDGSNKTLLFNEDSVCGYYRPNGERKTVASGELGHVPGDVGFDTPNFSPDGSKILVGWYGDLSVFDVASQTCTELFSSYYSQTQARFSPDGSKIALVDRIPVRDPYTGRIVNTKGLRILNADGTPISFFRPENFQTTPTWSPDGTKIAYFASDFYFDNDRWLFNNDQLSIFDLNSSTVAKVYTSPIDYFHNAMAWRGIAVPQYAVSLKFAPATVLGGAVTQGTVKVDPALVPVEGVTVQLSLIGDPMTATLQQSSVFIPFGESEAVFQVDAAPSSVFTSVDILAELGADTARATVVIMPGATPSADLNAVSFTAPASINVNTLFSMSWTLENIGSVSAFSYDDFVYLSVDDQLDDTDVVIQKTRRSTLAAGASVNRTSNFQITTQHAPVSGQYYLIFSTNDSRVTLENGSYANNTLVRPVEVNVVTPDLVLENISLPGQVETGTSFPFSYTVRNVGNGTATGTFSNVLYLSQDNIRGNSDDIFIESFNSSNLAAGASFTRSGNATIQTLPVRPDGNYFFYIATDNGGSVIEGGHIRSQAEANNVHFQPTEFFYRAADLQVTAASSAADVDTDVAFPLTWTTANTGNKDAGAFSERVYFSLDNAVGSDTLLGTFPLSGGLAAGSSVERIQNVSIPFNAIAATGNFYVYVQTDWNNAVNEGANENNNIRFHPVRVRKTQRPNLTVSNITAAATAFFAQTVQVQWTVTNSGSGATNTPVWKDSVYIGTGTTLSGATKLADSSNVSYLNAGESYIATVTVKIPRGLVGSYRFLVQTDSGSQVPESNENDNLANKTVTLSAPPLPDLTVSNVQAPAQVFAGQPIQITWQVNNIGTAMASGDPGANNVSQNFVNRVFLSQNTTLDANDIAIFTGAPMNHIPAGGNRSGTTVILDQNGVNTTKIPANISGNWYVFVLTDQTNRVYEFNNENNNSDYDRVQPGSPMSILITPPDLVIQDQPTAPATANGGQFIPVSFTVKNQGAFATTNGWRDAIYLSADQTIDANDAFLGYVFRSGLGPGEQYVAEMNVKIPDCLNGTYYLIALADYDNRLTEFDPNFNAEANNASPVKEIELTTIPPDLQITNFQITPPITTAGQNVSLSWTVTNTGAGPAVGAWTDRAAVHTTGFNPVTLASAQRQGPLAPGASYTATVNIAIPTFLLGDSFIRFTTDVNSNIAECGAAENNNMVDSAQFGIASILPDLVVDTADAPGMVVAGELFNVSWLGRNAGQPLNGTVTGWRDTVYISTDQTLSNSDRSIGSIINQANLGTNETYQRQLSVNTGNLTAGNYYLLIKADSANNIYEGVNSSPSEQNNVYSIPISVTSPLVDLTAAVNGVQTPTYSGTMVNITWTVSNVGSSSTLGSSWSDHVFLSRDSILDTTDTHLGFQQRTGVLGGGESYQVMKPFYIPNGLTGEYFIFVVTDRNNQIVESNNNNNTSPAYAATLQLAPPADLNITNISAPAAVAMGELNTTISWTVQNSGPNSTSGQWRDSVYFSRDAFWDPADYLVGQKDTQQSLGVNATYTESLTTTIPPVEEGVYYVIIRTDSRNVVRELNEANNTATAASPTTVTIQTLEMGIPFVTTSIGRNYFFKTDPPDDETMLITLFGDAGRKNELFTKAGSMVSRASYDLQGIPTFNPQENKVDNTEPGAYYTMAATEPIPPAVPPTPPQDITVEAKIIPFSIQRVSPESAGNDGYATIVADGAKYQPGATITLIAPNGETLTSLQSRNGTTKIAAIFDLKGRSAGDYDVVVTNPNNESVMLEDGFEVVNGGGHSLRRSINGPGAIRPGSTGRTRYTFSAINDGLNDAIDVPVVITLPEGMNFELDTANYLETTSELLPPGMNPADVPLAQDIDGRRVLFFNIPILRSRSSAIINLDIFPPASGDFQIGFFVYPPLKEMLAKARDLTTNEPPEELLRMVGQGVLTEEECYAELFRQFAFAVIGLFGPADACLGVLFGAATFVADAATGAALSNYAGDGSYGQKDIVENGANATLGLVTDIASCLAMSAPIPKLISFAYTIKNLMAKLADCLKIPLYGISRPQSWDPNEKIGPEGFGAERFVPVEQPLEYRINFENLPTATAPAQRISITDVLPPSLDLRTVRLKEIGFKQYRYVVPPNQAFYQSRVQLGTDLSNLQADLVAGVDLVSGQIFWDMTAIDPQTGELPIDPLVGLLPPNNENKDGEGYVIFTVEARSNFPSRTVINNFATIIFDDNEAIITDPTTNLLDAVVPTSTVLPLPATSDLPVFTVAWTGTDDEDGSGFRGYDIYYSENGGPYFPLIRDTPETSTAFIGKWGKTYRFYSIASDNAGNIEKPPILPDATIRVRGGDMEADVAPRPDGNDGQVSTDDVTQVRRFVAGLDTDLLFNEFQRADSAPRTTNGNGALSVTDVMQARRYASGLDAKQAAAGPNEAQSFNAASITGKAIADSSGREIRPIFVSRTGNVVTIGVELQAQGDETGASFTLEYDPSILSDPTSIVLGDGSGSAVLTSNTTQSGLGKLGIVVDRAANDPYPAGTHLIMTVNFTVAMTAPATTMFGFGNSPVLQEISNGSADALSTKFSGRSVMLLPPTSAGVNVGGRVFGANGAGLRGAAVRITDPFGAAKMSRTNSFGMFIFENIPSGANYVITVSSNRYQFTPQMVQVQDNIDDLMFTPIPQQYKGP